MSAGFYHNIALRKDGCIVAWGLGYRNEVSDTPKDCGYIPIPAATSRSFSLWEDGSIGAWGWDNADYGQTRDTSNFKNIL